MVFSSYLWSHPMSDFRRVPLHFDDRFSHRERMSNLMQSMTDHMKSAYIRPWHYVDGMQNGMSKIEADQDNFKVVLDVQHFSPNEITVKTIENQVVIEAKHEEKADEHGYVSRHFVRRYQLPRGVQIDSVTSTLSSDGVLSVSAPRNPPLEPKNVRTIPITLTEESAVKKDGESPKAEEEEKTD